MNDSANPYQAPQAPVVQAPHSNEIATLQISDKWKNRFYSIAKAGGPGLPHLETLSKAEQRGITFNMFAFLFGPIYFLTKGLWKQALLYTSVTVVVAVIAINAKSYQFSQIFPLAIGLAYGFRANMSYYQRLVLGHTPWA